MKTARLLAEYTVAISLFQEKYDGRKYVFECQHGEQECLVNMIQVADFMAQTCEEISQLFNVQ